jgi:hypothetical protein
MRRCNQLIVWSFWFRRGADISVAIKFALISFLLTGWLSSHIDYEGLENCVQTFRPGLRTVQGK